MQPMANGMRQGFTDIVVEALRGYAKRTNSDKSMLGRITLKDENLDQRC